MSGGGLRTKWLAVAQKIDDERVQLALCDGDREHWRVGRGVRLLAIVDQRQSPRRPRTPRRNQPRAINLAIRPIERPRQYGDDIDVWSSPLATLSRGTGRLRDYAIAKIRRAAPGRIPRRICGSW